MFKSFLPVGIDPLPAFEFLLPALGLDEDVVYLLVTLGQDPLEQLNILGVGHISELVDKSLIYYDHRVRLEVVTLRAVLQELIDRALRDVIAVLGDDIRQARGVDLLTLADLLDLRYPLPQSLFQDLTSFQMDCSRISDKCGPLGLWISHRFDIL